MVRKFKPRKRIDECEGFSNAATNIGGMGNVVFPGVAPSDAVGQCSPENLGSGDVPTVIGKMNKQAGPVTEKKKGRKVRNFKKRQTI